MRSRRTLGHAPRMLAKPAWTQALASWSSAPSPVPVTREGVGVGSSRINLMPRQARAGCFWAQPHRPATPAPLHPRAMGLLAHSQARIPKARHLTMSCGERDTACEPEPAQIHQRGNA